MLYKVTGFHTGKVKFTAEVEATTHLNAAKKISKGYNFGHLKVEGKTTKRFDSCLVLIQGIPMAHKADLENPIIMLTVGRACELYAYKSFAERDKVYEEIIACITSTSAESAKAEAGQTDTIASSEETNGTKSTLTLKKILNGFATNATWQDLLTQDNIAKISGTPKLEDTGMYTWPTTSKTSHSKPVQTSKCALATVLLPSQSEQGKYPGFTGPMKTMVGKTYKFISQERYMGTSTWKGGGYYFRKSWLDFDHVVVKVKDLPEGTVSAGRKGTKARYSPRYAGKIFAVKKCFCGCGLYNTGGMKGIYFHPGWLEPVSDNRVKIDRLERR